MKMTPWPLGYDTTISGKGWPKCYIIKWAYIYMEKELNYGSLLWSLFGSATFLFISWIYLRWDSMKRSHSKWIALRVCSSLTYLFISLSSFLPHQDRIFCSHFPYYGWPRITSSDALWNSLTILQIKSFYSRWKPWKVPMSLVLAINSELRRHIARHSHILYKKGSIIELFDATIWMLSATWNNVKSKSLQSMSIPDCPLWILIC